MSDDSSSPSVSVVSFLDEFYDAIETHLQYFRREETLQTHIRTTRSHVARFWYLIIQALLDPELAVPCLDDLSLLMEHALEVLYGMDNMLEIPEEALQPFRGLSVAVLHEVSVSFQRIFQQADYPIEKESQYESLVLAVRLFVLWHDARFEIIQDSSGPVPRFDALVRYLDSLQEVLRDAIELEVPDDEDDIFMTDAATDDIIENCTLSYVYKKIKRTTYTEDPDEQCTICLCNLQDGDEGRRLPCFHFFHKKCADPWLQKNKRCPICKMYIDEENEEFPLCTKDKDAVLA